MKQVQSNVYQYWSFLYISDYFWTDILKIPRWPQWRSIHTADFGDCTPEWRWKTALGKEEYFKKLNSEIIWNIFSKSLISSAVVYVSVSSDSVRLCTCMVWCFWSLIRELREKSERGCWCHITDTGEGVISAVFLQPLHRHEQKLAVLWELEKMAHHPV